MLKTFRPEFSGTYSPESLRPDFIVALAARVRRGLCPLASERRNRYEIVTESERELRFRSRGLLAAITMGWNDVRAQLVDFTPTSPAARPKVHYNVTYFGWAAYGVALCGFIAVCLIAAWSLFGDRFGVRQSAATTVFWIMAVFWGFVWPWILVALHKRPAARAIERLFAEINSSTE